MLLLLEEVGELAKSIRKNATDMGIDNNKANKNENIEKIEIKLLAIDEVYSY